jgi:hypothetical protein
MSDPSENANLQPIASMLDRLSQELEAAVAVIHGLEDVVGHAISSAKTPGEIRITELQELDHVRQKIEGSAAFLRALLPALPEHWLVDPDEAAGTVGMSALARRLSGEDAARTMAPEELIELF